MVANNFKPLDEREEAKPVSASFARCMKKVIEIDPLECQECHEQMKIVTFLHDPREIEKIATYLGLPTWRAPADSALRRIYVDSSSEFSQLPE